MPSDDQVRAIEAPHVGRHSVDAGAGTGKTTTLALRALYLIESGRVRADQIVVMTFTKKAAAEIGARIADTLDRARADGAEFAGSDRGVRCTTIHGLAADVLREFAFDFDLSTPPRAISDGEAYGIFHEAFVALLERRLEVDTSAFPIAEINRDGLERDLGKLALHLKNHGVSPAMFASRALAEAERFERQTWGQLWTAGANGNGRRTKVIPKNEVSGEERVLEARRERSNIHVVTALFAEFDRRLRERAAATYGDLIGETTRHLRDHPGIIARLRERWRYVMVDESQDSSDLQLRFLETIFGGPGDADAAGMMPVGDRRQAIYGFNGAGEDVMARIAGEPDSTHALVVNRRSPQEIVDAAHAVLEKAEIVNARTPKLVASAGSGTLSCVRVATFGVDGGATKDHVKVEAAAIAAEVERLLADATTKRSDIAILVRRRTHANAYVGALNARGITAALDRRSGLFTADAIRDALAWMSWLVDLGDRQAAVRVLQSPLCGLCDAATIRLADDKHWLERLLRDEITAPIDTDTRERVARVRASIVALLPTVELPLAQAVEHILRDVPLAASYARMGATVGAQAIVNLRSFEALADEFAADVPDGRLADFVADVKRRILYDDEPQEAELDLDGVRVMTIHQAKGLEWPYVFVACATKNQYGTAGPSDAVVAYDLATGAFALKNDIDGRETFHWSCMKDEHDPATGERYKNSPRKDLAEREQARVFYVALTRAKRTVYVSAPSDPKKPQKPLAHVEAIQGWAESNVAGVDLRFATADAPVAGAGQRALPDGPPLEPFSGEGPAIWESSFRPRVSFTSIATFAQCPRLARLRYRLRLPDLRESSPRFVGLDDGPSASGNAARLGSLTHRILELWGRAKIAGSPCEIDRAFDDARWEFADLSEAQARDARLRSVHAIAFLEPFQLLGVEESFSINVGDTQIEGAIDLIARGPDDITYVIDYKTGVTVDEHYALQLALYVRAAETRYRDRDVRGAILRLTASTATMTVAPPVTDGALSKAVANVGLLESDEARVGSWCDFCVYNGSPCDAPRAAGPAPHDPLIAPETLTPVIPHGDVDDTELENVRVDGPEPEDTTPVLPDPEVDIDED